jgi:hypothetical protein
VLCVSVSGSGEVRYSPVGSRPREPREPGRGANVFRLPPTDRDAIRAFLQVQRRSILAAEHEIVLSPHLPRREPFCGLAGAVGTERIDGPGGQLQHAPALAGLGVTLAPHGPVEGHRADLEIDLIPRDRPGLLGMGADEQRRLLPSSTGSG